MVTYKTIPCWCKKFGTRFADRAKAARQDCGKALFSGGAALKPGTAKNRYRPVAHYPAAKADIPELAHVMHVFVGAAARVENRAENSHQSIRRRKRQMCGFRDAHRTRAFLSCFGPIRQHFTLRRHQMNATFHRVVLKERVATWHDWTVTRAVEKVI
ncbi:putative transposase [Caballeronia udeis]|uniref:Transposase n=1 Tax=Caballeronia udeis TaxID=1232866 RepID=A0ABW8MR11_9BURK